MYKYIYKFAIYLWNQIFTYIPSARIRRYILKLYLNDIGKNSWFGIGVKFKHPKNIIVGDDVVVAAYVFLDGRKGIQIESHVSISMSAKIWTLTHDPRSESFETIGSKVVIKNNVWIGSDAVICPGVTLESFSVIGLGSYVNKSTNINTIYAGQPAREISKRNIESEYNINYKPFLDS